MVMTTNQIRFLKTSPVKGAAFTATGSFLVEVDGKIVGRITRHDVSRSNVFWTAQKSITKVLGTFTTRDAAVEALTK